jgi:hypothetical protein
MNKETAYIPGVCNINYEEVAIRRKWRNIGFVASFALFAFLIVLGTNRYSRLAVFLPLFVGFVGYFQVKNRFCVSYAAAGMQNADEGSKSASKVSEENTAKDKAKARKMNFQAFVGSIIVTALAILIPVI